MYRERARVLAIVSFILFVWGGGSLLNPYLPWQSQNDILTRLARSEAEGGSGETSDGDNRLSTD